jgi:dynein heavy chain
VKDTIGKWKDITWAEIKGEIGKMKETIDQFDKDCKKLPGPLRSWDAYKELKEEIENMK